MNYALDQFTLTDGTVFVVQGANSLFTYQNLGIDDVLIQGSNDTLQWVTIQELPSGSSLVLEHSYKYLRSSGLSNVSVNRGEGNNRNDSSPVTSVNAKTGAVNLNHIDVDADPKGAAAEVRQELETALAGLSSTKLDASEYIQHFKGVFPSKAALDLAFPTAQAGDTADIDSGSGFDVMRAIWDESDQKWIIREVNNAQNTDQVPEGNNNKYFTGDRVRETTIGTLTPVTPSEILPTDDLVEVVEKLQAHIKKLTATWVPISTVATVQPSVSVNNIEVARINGMLWIRGSFQLNTNVSAADFITITDNNYKTIVPNPADFNFNRMANITVFTNETPTTINYRISANRSTHTIQGYTGLGTSTSQLIIQPTCIGKLMVQ